MQGFNYVKSLPLASVKAAQRLVELFAMTQSISQIRDRTAFICRAQDFSVSKFSGRLFRNDSCIYRVFADYFEAELQPYRKNLKGFKQC